MLCFTGKPKHHDDNKHVGKDRHADQDGKHMDKKSHKHHESKSFEDVQGELHACSIVKVHQLVRHHVH